ncbi:MAG TPA: pyridoxamine 5'-phosphate oxidase family protein [Ramlibacter sp.]|nr:pyridoxamine 5'-phosphate oxidase family protein [Ramlibacter sp.]
MSVDAAVRTFHEGEVALQEAAGSMARLAEIGPRVIRDYMPDQHRQFFAQLPFLIAGTIDADGQPWASVLAAAPGFVRSPDDRHLIVHAAALPHDPLGGALAAGAPIGLLGIEPHTRRRNRANGHVVRIDSDRFTVRVEQSFGNCPKYIQARRPEFVDRSQGVPVAERSAGLDEAALRVIAAADTLFIASAHPDARETQASALGVDVSHRGGKPGFVRADANGRVLTIPDYPGNAFFNTLGNLAVNPRCGLLFIDFDRGDLLHVAASATIVSEPREVAAVPGAERLLRIEVVSMLRVRSVLPLKWGPAELSPFLDR